MLALLGLAGGAVFAAYYKESSAGWEQARNQFTQCDQRSSAACTVDGDTVRITNRRIRLTGFDTPELRGSCQAERQLAVVAREELTQWLNRGPFELDGGAEPPRDQYGRELRAARREGEYLADVMIARGLARSNGWGAGAADWC
ncbi:thermonuclease family protein [Aurantiacibacter marinus]|nr:thermonuclease family protein [Aurantiacibacter marinus]